MRARYVAFAAIMGVSSSVAAQEPPASTPLDHAVEQRPERFRVDLGMDFIGAGVGGLNGGSWWPLLTTTGEVRAGGPAWIFLRAFGSYRRDELDGLDGESWSAGGRLGVRVEIPTFEWLEIGGSASFVSAYNQFVDSSLSAGTLSVGALAGPSAHFRIKRFFGMRVGLDLLSAGHIWTANLAHRGSSSYATLQASPTFEMTFTF